MTYTLKSGTYLQLYLNLRQLVCAAGAWRRCKKPVTAHELSPDSYCTAAAVSNSARFAVSISGRNSAAVIPSVPPEKPSM